MILPIYLYGSPVLRKPAEEVSLEDAGLRQFITDLWDTMYHADGVGLAAPQVGRSLRIFVVDGTPIGDDRPEVMAFKRVMINPKIVEESPRMVAYSEGCLSIPELNADIERPAEIVISYYDEQLQPQTERLMGFACRMVQHEYDHLEGRLFTDLAAPIRKKMLQSKLQIITKGKGRTSYRTIIEN